MNFIKLFFELPHLTQIIILYLIFINVITFFYFGIDKLKSQFDQWRISEKTLWILTIIGGSAGSLTGIFFFRHKTQKHSFQVVIILILLLQISLLMLFFSNII